MDHDTTVASIVALNGFSSADQMIRDGQELIIAVPEPDLQIRITMGEVYEEDYTAEPIIIENDSWYTTKEVVHDEGTTGHRERNDVVVYENGIEVSREMIHENVMIQSEPAVIERGTIVPPTYIKPLSGGRYTSGFGRRWGRMDTTSARTLVGKMQKPSLQPRQIRLLLLRYIPHAIKVFFYSVVSLLSSH